MQQQPTAPANASESTTGWTRPLDRRRRGPGVLRLGNPQPGSTRPPTSSPTWPSGRRSCPGPPRATTTLRPRDQKLTPKNGFLSQSGGPTTSPTAPTGSYSTCGYNWGTSNTTSRTTSADCTRCTSVPTTTCSGRCTRTTQCSSPATARGLRPLVRQPDRLPQPVDHRRPPLPVRRHTTGGAAATPTVQRPTRSRPLRPGNSSYGNAVEPPPSTNAQLGVLASQNGCLYWVRPKSPAPPVQASAE